MSTSVVWLVKPDYDIKGYPSIDSSLKENRGIDRTILADMNEGLRPADPAFLNSIDFRVKTKLKAFDILFLDRGYLVSERVRDLFETEAYLGVEFVRQKVNGLPFYFLRIGNMIDCLDTENSKIKYLRPGKILEIEQYSFHKDRIPDPAIFKIPERMGSVYVTDSVRSTLERQGFVGFHFIDAENPTDDERMYMN